MNISVVKKKRFFSRFFKAFLKLFKPKAEYIQIPISTVVNEIKKTEEKEKRERLMKIKVRNQIRTQNIAEIRDLVMSGQISIDVLTIEDIEELNNLYIEENKKLAELNKEAKLEIEKWRKKAKV